MEESSSGIRDFRFLLLLRVFYVFIFAVSAALSVTEPPQKGGR